jgi:GNAT superfamily N-acetyltransferase
MEEKSFDTLENVAIEAILTAFLDAFSDYEIKIEMPLEKFKEMLSTRSFCARYSMGCFVDGKLAGFVLFGYREINGQKYGYDIATGIIKAYQKKGLGDLLLKALLSKMKEWGMDYFVLEVLENNTPAQKLYLNNGFKISRKLNCYKKMLSKSAGETALEPVEGDEALQQIDEPGYLSFAPSWQNALTSYQNIKSQYHLEIVRECGSVVGYGMIHKERGDIMQVGLAPEKRNKESVEELINRLGARTQSDKLSFLNVEDGSELDKILRDLNFESTVNQFEMIYEVK